MIIYRWYLFIFFIKNIKTKYIISIKKEDHDDFVESKINCQNKNFPSVLYLSRETVKLSIDNKKFFHMFTNNEDIIFRHFHFDSFIPCKRKTNFKIVMK